MSDLKQQETSVSANRSNASSTSRNSSASGTSERSGTSDRSGTSKWIYLIPLAIFVLMVVLLASGLGKDPTKLDSTLIGQPLPQFNKSLLVATNQFSLEQTVTQADLKGPALINIFASWCPSCYFEHPDLMKLSEAGEITIYGINYKDKREAGLKFINDLGNPYDMIIFDRNGRLGIDLGVYGAPETFVLDANNKIIYRHVGVVTQKVWHDLLKPMLNLEQSEATISGGAE
jgi:cytochrome c biogenesis protein CcmG, thiol:disulfide interchange protein DsbE